MTQYRLFDRIGYYPNFSIFKNSIEGILAFSGTTGPNSNLHKLIVESWQGKAFLI